MTISQTFTTEAAAAFGRAFGYQATVRNPKDRAKMIANPETLEAFIQRMHHDFAVKRIGQQSRRERALAARKDAESEAQKAAAGVTTTIAN